MNGNKLVSKIIKIENVYAKIEENITTVLFISMCICILIQVICRFVLKWSVPWTEEFIRYAFIAVSFLGAGCVLKTNSHIEVDLVSGSIEKIKDEHKKESLEQTLNIIKDIVIIVVATYIATLCWKETSTFFKFGQISPAIKVPLWIISGTVLYGFVSIIFHSVCHFIIELFGRRGKECEE